MRPLGGVQKKAWELGRPFAGVRKVRANLRAFGAIEAQEN